MTLHGDIRKSHTDALRKCCKTPHQSVQCEILLHMMWITRHVYSNPENQHCQYICNSMFTRKHTSGIFQPCCGPGSKLEGKGNRRRSGPSLRTRTRCAEALEILWALVATEEKLTILVSVSLRCVSCAYPRKPRQE